MTEEIILDLESWFLERPLWIQDATMRIISNGSLNDTDIIELVLLCKKEVGILDGSISEIQPKKVLKGTLKGYENTCELFLESITGLTGISALTPKKPLEFENKLLTIVYGRNGSGKSSYVRVLKHACGARNPGKLLGDIYNEQDVPQSCVFNIKQVTGKKQISWSSVNGINDDLKAIEIYDTECAQVYMNAENEVTFEPWILSLFTQLTNICTRVSKEIQNEITKCISTKPVMTTQMGTTQNGIWYSKLSHKTSDKDVASNCTWNAEIENELNSLKQRLLENNPAEKAKSLRNKKAGIENLFKIIKLLEEGLNDAVCNNYLSLKSDATLKRKVANEDAKKIFENAPLDGIGTESWKLLWEQARAFSEKTAYPDLLFPNTLEDSKCVLCQQPLDNDAKVRLLSFEEFIKGNLEKQAKDSEEILKNLSEGIVKVPNDDSLNLILLSAGITEVTEIENIKTIFLEIEKRKDSLLKAIVNDTINVFPDTDSLNYLSIQTTGIEEQACAFEEDAAKDSRDIIQGRVNELESKRWLSQQKNKIEDEILRLKSINLLDQALKLTKTQGLSTKKSELSDKLVTEEYIKRFQSELKELGASHIKVELVKTRAKVGHIYHQIKLRGCVNNTATPDILSEGELRIVSLAAFLADVESRKECTPFIFDDPISSLDQEYEEATVKRLIELSKSRQLIVFTHRISLLTLLEETAKKESVESAIICLRSEKWGVGEPGDTPINVKRPDTALNVLLDQRLPKAKKILEEVGQVEYDLISKGICSDFRILIERFIENKLLGDVVHRFRRAVNTQGKLEKLALITSEDCKLFEGFMTKYSKYEHSQSDELEVNPPMPEELKEDMEILKKWHIEFSKRVS